ncbi:ComEA family DNA-binding protein [Flavobacterium macrobrachii]|jgi:DNA uptake protein ComE-like DNA-binding protein|uniref:Helix-hairpin-helix domain-containing protein n=1 Tax=Flavobacterium macrobrachii TaxID=591204 RepID=A0ABS2CZ15_9FLAO|nr:helix-hairpin-helix domain-containing protein [Flavobacterium macrobrachii]MBM6500211.1 helix-hairpin-helix domain-containing protein [Flavobacterium macrobrachii]
MNANNTFRQTVLSYSKSQRIGIIFLFILIFVCQGIYFFNNFNSTENSPKEKAQWLSFQKEMDSLKLFKSNFKPTIYPFNPNFITDFKGYKLGMSVVEIDRLLAFRKQNKFVNSAEEFQQVTKVSDSLLKKISPYFKFPDWVKNKKSFNNSYEKKDFSKPEKKFFLDINLASQEDLIKVYGIGEGLSKRILEQKEKLGSFVSMEQMNDVWGLSPEVIENLNKSFFVKNTSAIKKMNINSASIKELSQFPYFKYNLAKEIVTYRTMNGDIKIEDLTKIKGFPVEKLKIIALYLEF